MFRLCQPLLLKSQKCEKGEGRAGLQAWWRTEGATLSHAETKVLSALYLVEVPGLVEVVGRGSVACSRLWVLA